MTGDEPLPPPGAAAAWTRTVFERGDYAGAAMYGCAGTWQHHAARALLRGDAAATTALAAFDVPEARLHLGAARWIHGDAAGARRLLATVPLAHAQNLVRLLEQPRIRVLSQLPWLRNTPTDLLGGAAHDPALEVRNVGYHATDVPNHPYAEVARFGDAGFTPDFYLAAMVEWQHVPPDLQTLPCPIFGHIADHDLHAQTLLPWLHLYDELCVTDRTEWLDVQGLTDARVSSFPKVFGLPGDLPAVPSRERHLDFFVSGTMLDPYHPDKAALLHELLSLPGIDLRLVRGFTGPMAYRTLLAASKASFTYVRRAGAMPTRGLEALAMGCAVAVQEQSSLRLFVGDDEGLVPYGPRTGSLAAAMQTILGDWQRHGAAAARGAQRVREQFAMPVVASQYLRFLTFRAAAPRPLRRHHDTRTWCQKRVSVSRTWLPDNPAARRRSMQANFRQLGKQLTTRPGVAVLLDMARELLCEFAFYCQRDQDGADERALFADAIRLLEHCERLHPHALVPRFVRLRALLHHGTPDQRRLALQAAAELVGGDAERWQVDAADDVMPFDFHGESFDYRTYLDLVIAAAKGAPVATADLRRLLLAALAGHLAEHTGDPELHERAARWNPEFARHQLAWARALVRRGRLADREQAGTLLRELVHGSTEFAAAARLLHELDPEQPVPLALRRIDEQTLDANLTTEALFDVERRAPALARRATDADPGIGARAEVAVLVPDAGDPRQLAALLTDLGGQSLAAGLQVVVALPPAAVAHAPVLRAFAGAFAGIHAVATAALAGRADRLEACRRAADAPLSTIAHASTRLRPDALALLREQLRQHAQAVVAFGNDGWSDRASAHFDPTTCSELTCWPPFTRGGTATRDRIGLHPMWHSGLHDRHGGFDTGLGCAAERAFWRRATADGEVCQVHTLLAIRARETGADHPAAGAPTLPATLFAPALREEAESHARLGILDTTTLADVRQLEEFYGTALLHGDHPTALRLLRAAVETVPSLLSARLALARLMAATGIPGWREVLTAARTCEPYHDLTARLCADAARTAPAHPATETEPCPTAPLAP